MVLRITRSDGVRHGKGAYETLCIIVQGSHMCDKGRDQKCDHARGEYAVHTAIMGRDTTPLKRFLPT